MPDITLNWLIYEGNAHINALWKSFKSYKLIKQNVAKYKASLNTSI